MHVCGRGNFGKQKLGEPKRKGVAHGVNKNVGNQKTEGIPGHDEGTKRLAGKSEARPCGGEDPMAGGEVEKIDGGRVEVNVEAVLTRLATTAADVEAKGDIPRL